MLCFADYKRFVDEMYKTALRDSYTYHLTCAPNSDNLNNKALSEERVANISYELGKNIDTALFGKNFHRLKDTETIYRTKFIGTVEHLDSNRHFHLLASVCKPKRALFESRINDVFRIQFPAGNVHITTIQDKNREDKKALLAYPFKEFWKEANQEYLIVSYTNQKHLTR